MEENVEGFKDCLQYKVDLQKKEKWNCSHNFSHQKTRSRKRRRLCLIRYPGVLLP